MNKKIILSLLVLTFFLVPFISATCTVTLDKTSYSPTETATAEMTCSAATEKSDAYTLNWTFQNGTSVELDTGTTPATVGENFYQSYTIPSTWPSGIFINATLQGTDLEGTDSANISGATANSLLITGATIGGKWLGLTSSVQATVKDENDKRISGGNCKVSAWSNDETQMLLSATTSLFGGQLKIEGIFSYESFDESKDYAVLLNCYCGSTGSSSECIDEDGTAVTNSIGSAKTAFTTNQWLIFNQTLNNQIVYYNGTDYPNAVVYSGYGEKVYWILNMTNPRLDKLRIISKTYIVDNSTKANYEESGDTFSFSVGGATPQPVLSFEIPSSVPSGVYFIRQYLDIYYENILVSQDIEITETFNVTGTDESFSLTSVTTDKTNYYTGEEIHICANITNNFDQRVEFEILYNYRCGSTNDDFNTDRSLLGEHTELRALSAGTSRYQCAAMIIPYEDHLMYINSQCYASVTLQSPYINTFDNKRSLTGSQFNITDFGMYPEYEIDPSYPLVRLFPDWRRFDDVIDNITKSYYRSKINISKLEESYLDPNDEIIDDAWDVYTIFSNRMPCSTEIYNYSVEYANGTQIDNDLENKAITWKKEDGEVEDRCAIGIENVNFSDPLDDYFIVKVWFEDFEERQTEALEGIENKTGTFHLDVACPSQGLIGGDLTCAITAQIEDPQVVQKEVDFTCYITDGTNIYSSINFNQMVTQSSITLSQEFPIPSTFTSNQQYTLQCYADYFNFGSRRDSFYDTFNAVTTITSSGGSGYITNPSLLTGGAIIGIGDEMDTPKEKPEFPIDFDNGLVKLFATVLILLMLLFIIVRSLEKKKQTKKEDRINWKDFGKVILSLAILFGVVVGIIYLSRYLGSVSLINKEQLASIFQDNLIRGMVLTLFITAIVIILFKALNIRGDIKIGKDETYKKTKKNFKLTKLQEEINAQVLKQELKHLKNLSKQ